MPTPPATDPAPAQVPALLAEIDRATDRVASSLARLDHESFHAPSLLTGWTRATIAAHLTWVARRYAQMTGEVRAGLPAVTYPGGPEERAASLTGFAALPPQEAVRRFRAAAAGLADCWRPLDDARWRVSFVERRIGPMRLSRLVALRLTELEVHHVDLGVHYGVEDWPPAFVDVCLPLRLAWLGTHHRAEPAPAVRGRWLFTACDRRRSWLVSTDRGSVELREAGAGTAADTVLAGPSSSLLAFLLGRRPPAPLEIGGDRRLAAALKQVFPGP